MRLSFNKIKPDSVGHSYIPPQEREARMLSSYKVVDESLTKHQKFSEACFKSSLYWPVQTSGRRYF